MDTGAPVPSAVPPGRLTSDPARTAVRTARLEAYFTAQVLDGDDMLCRDLGACRRSATADQFGRARPDTAFAAGQLSHVGAHYDLTEDGRELRILVVAMETGRPDENVAMPRRRAQIAASAELPMSTRNPHMRGVMNALRVAVGRAPGADRAGELLDLTGCAGPVHLFDAYAMTNLRLCSAFRVDSTDSRGTRTMSRNCLRHLAATVSILEPTLCIVQGVEVGRHVATALTGTRRLTPHLQRGLLAGVPTVVATFTHPSARGDQRWGGLAAVPYLYDTVVPALQQARRLREAPDELLGPVTDAGNGLGPPPAPRRRPVPPALRTTPAEQRSLRSPTTGDAPAAASNHQVAEHARRVVADEVRRRGGRVVERQVGRRTELLAHTRTGRVVELRVLSRRAGDWQTSIRNGDLSTTVDNRYWVLVHLARSAPEFYVVPEDWMIRDIRREHDEYLARHGGRRAVTADSLHHRIQTARVRRWHERWDPLS